MGKGKGRPGLSGDPQLDCALWRLVEVLAEIALPDSHLERDSGEISEISKDEDGQDNALPMEKEELEQE